MRLLAIFFLIVGWTGSVYGHWNDVEIQSADGIALKASYISPAKPGPAILLLHQCNMDRKSWKSIGTQLHDAGVHVLTLDLRGFGESGGEGIRGSGGFGEFLQKSQSDVDLAFDFLAGQPGVDTSKIAAGGASCGAMLSAGLATRRDLAAIMLLSGPPSDSAIAYIAANPGLAVFAAAATEDAITPGVDDRLKQTVEASAHPRSTAKIYAGTEHGMPMMAKNPELEPVLMTWLKRELLED